VVWAGLEGDVDALVALAADIEAQVAPLGYPPEQRAFRAHLTIGRVKGPRNLAALTEALDRRSPELATAAVELSQFALYQSELGAGGARYCVLSTYPLGDA
jgi:2'-5' RNA ligase